MCNMLSQLVHAWTHTLRLRGQEHASAQEGVLATSSCDGLLHFICETHHVSHQLVMGKERTPIEVRHVFNFKVQLL